MSQHATADGLLLPGIDGANPLGFLAALGVLQILSTERKPCEVTMSWSSKDGSWTPILHGAGQNQKTIAECMARQLKCPFEPNTAADSKRKETQTAFDRKKSELKEATDQLRKEGLRGNSRKVAEEQLLGPIRTDYTALRSQWLSALRQCVPSLELSLGKHLNATCGELREHMEIAMADASHSARDILDLYAAFGSDVCSQEKSDQMQATSFCFITGSGRQYFLDTVLNLIQQVNAKRLEEAVFSRVEHQDEKYSMRWDPREDRRYAVMWSDPSPSGNKAKTNWAMNLLAYRGLQFLPSVPRAKGLRTVGWLTDQEPSWNWPIWIGRIPPSVVRSLLSHQFLTQNNDFLGSMGSLGVVAVYQSIRVQVGNPPLHKVNFTPSRRVA
jgi:hypothetical protein